MQCRYYDNTQKDNRSSFLTPTVVGGRRPVPSEICAQSYPSPFETRRLRQIFVYDVSTVKDFEKKFNYNNRKSITGFPTSYRWSVYVTPKSPKGCLKQRFLCFSKIKFNFNQTKSATKCLCVKTSSSRIAILLFRYLMIYRYWRLM